VASTGVKAEAIVPRTVIATMGATSSMSLRRDGFSVTPAR